MKRLWVLPKKFPLSLIGTAVESSTPSASFTFKHPRTRQNAQFAVCPAGQLYQIDCKFQPFGGRSAFFGDEIISDASLHFALPLNALFLGIGVLREWSLLPGKGVNRMSPLGEILAELAIPVQYVSIFQKGIEKIAVLREIGEEVYCKVDEEKVEAFLADQIVGLVTRFSGSGEENDVPFMRALERDYSVYCQMKGIVDNGDGRKNVYFVAIKALAHFIAVEDEERLMKRFGIEIGKEIGEREEVGKEIGKEEVEEAEDSSLKKNAKISGKEAGKYGAKEAATLPKTKTNAKNNSNSKSNPKINAASSARSKKLAISCKRQTSFNHFTTNK